MPSTTYTLFRSAILGEQQVVCRYDGRVRELCPHIIGTNKRGEEVVLAWQFGGESPGPFPQYCDIVSLVAHCDAIHISRAAQRMAWSLCARNDADRTRNLAPAPTTTSNENKCHALRRSRTHSRYTSPQCRRNSNLPASMRGRASVQLLPAYKSYG